MAIKLADVIENVNSSYPLLDASVAATTGGSIKGFGIFKSTTERDAVPTNKRCYGYIAVVLYNDGVINELSVGTNPVYTNVANLYDFNLSGSVTIEDGAGLDDLEGSPVDISTNLFDIATGARLYIYKPPTGGLVFSTSGSNAADTSNTSSNIEASDLDEEAYIGDEWEVASNWVEIPLASNANRRVPIGIIAQNQSDYFFNVFDSGTDNTTKSLNADDFFGWLLQGILYALADAGIGTVQNYTNSGTGLVGDYNGDGQITTADLLIFLGGFGTSAVSVEPNATVTDTTYANSGSTMGTYAFYPGIGTFEPAYAWGYAQWQDFLDNGDNYVPMVISAGQNSPGGTAGSFNVSYAAGQVDSNPFDSTDTSVGTTITFTKIPTGTGMSANNMQLNLHSMSVLDSAYQISLPNSGNNGGRKLRILIIMKLYDANNDQVGYTRGHPFTADLSAGDDIPGAVIYTSDYNNASTDNVINLIDFGIATHTDVTWNGVDQATAATVTKIEVSFFYTILAANELGVVTNSTTFDLKFETA